MNQLNKKLGKIAKLILAKPTCKRITTWHHQLCSFMAALYIIVDTVAY